METPEGSDFADVLKRLKFATGEDELRHLFFGALGDLGVDYCTALAVHGGNDGPPSASVIVQSLPVRFGFEQYSQRHPQAASMVQSLLAAGQPIVLDAQAVLGLSRDWQKGFREIRDALGVEWCLVAPLLRNGQLRGAAFYMAGHALSKRAVDCLIALTEAGYDQLALAELLPPPPSPLTQRQHDVLAQCALGKSDWEIAQLLGISPVTAHEHVEAAKRKLGVRTRVQAVAIATQNRWIFAAPST